MIKGLSQNLGLQRLLGIPDQDVLLFDIMVVVVGEVAANIPGSRGVSGFFNQHCLCCGWTIKAILKCTFKIGFLADTSGVHLPPKDSPVFHKL